MADLSEHNIHKFIAAARPILNNITVAEIMERIENFQKIDFRDIDDHALRSEIKKVLEIQTDGGPKIVNLISSKIIGKTNQNTVLYRVRKCSAQDYEQKTFVSMQREKDAWYPPKEFITVRGRLNEIGESFLYLAADPLMAIKEARLQPDDRFYLIQYHSTKPFRLAMLDSWQGIEEMTTLENQKLKLFNDFLTGEFTRIVEKGDEHLYRATNIIAKEYLHQSTVDLGWSYPSLFERHHKNVCFKTNLAHHYLELSGVRICLLRDTTNYHINFFYDLIGVDNEGFFVPYKCNSDTSKTTFPLMNAIYFPELL